MSQAPLLEQHVDDATTDGDWRRVLDADKLAPGERTIIRIDGRQILLLNQDGDYYACNNRCPHEGYPLKEGSLGDDCVLTCNWHNWKFDLKSGATLVGGDRLRRYPVQRRDEGLWLDLSEAPAAVRQARALSELSDSFQRFEYDRMARALGRFQGAGGDAIEALTAAIGWTHDRFEFGMTHAMAAGADWLALRQQLDDDPAERLVPVLEIVAHLAFDSLREKVHPYTKAVQSYDPQKFRDAILAEDEETAVAVLRGGLALQQGFEPFARPLAEAALAHYADFGHAAIYVYKAESLIEQLGPAAAEPVLLALTRSLVYSFREDLLPEFRDYGKCLAGWGVDDTKPATKAVTFAELKGANVRKALQRTAAAAGAAPLTNYAALLHVAAWNQLHFDLAVQEATDNAIADNVGWLDFTHALTFANACRYLCTRYPDLWPQALLQMACFAGRNAKYVDADLDISPWQVADAPAFYQHQSRKLLDHGQFEPIISAHLTKLVTAARAETLATPQADWVPVLAAAVNRFLHSPLKRRHVLRTARQALHFVAAE